MSKYIKLQDAIDAGLDFVDFYCDNPDAPGAMIEHMESVPAAEVIPLGVEMWSDRFEIKRRGWRSEDGEHMAESFMIVRKENPEQ